MLPSEIINFWFHELTPQDWWKKSDTLDSQIRERFTHSMEAAARGELFAWRKTPQGRLAEIILTDQFPRNAFRNSARAFATDALALILSQEMVAQNLIEELPESQRAFALMPYMHSESRLIHDCAVKLFEQFGLKSNLEFELKHKEIIDRFGRYPHRNSTLGRTSTSEEIEFLKTHFGF